MKIPDSIVLSQNYQLGSEQYAAKEALKAFPSMNRSESARTVSRASEVSDVVSLSVQAKSNSKQIHSPAKIDSSGQSGIGSESNGNESFVHLIEMLTGIKVELLTQAKLIDEAEKRSAVTLKKDEMNQVHDTVSAASTVLKGTEKPAVQTNGILKSADGKEIDFSPESLQSKDVINSAGLTNKHDSLPRNGIETYSKGKMKEVPSKEHVLPTPSKAEPVSDVRHKSKVIVQLSLESKLEPASNHPVVSA